LEDYISKTRFFAVSLWQSSSASIGLSVSECAALPALRPLLPARPFLILHQTCSQDADDETEHRIKYYEPDRCICDGRPVRFESHLCLHILSSAEPELIKNAQDREGQSALYKDNFFGTIVPDDRGVVHDFGIAAEQSIAPPVDESAGAQGKK
jgi:hypothetical protein